MSALRLCGRAWVGAFASGVACVALACGNEADRTQLGGPDSAIASARAASGSGDGDAAEPGAIVFRSDRDRAGIGELYVMAPDGSDVRRLTDGGDYFMPLWSPDGESVAFRQVSGLSASVGLISFSGESPVQLVSDLDPELTTDHSLGWSDDKLIYDSHETGPDTDLRVVSRSGGQRDFFFPTRDGRRYQADVFKDGRIGFTWTPETARSTRFAAGFRDLWVAKAPDDPAPENLTEGRAYAPFDPRWSPDGTKIAFQAFAFLPDGTVEGLGSHADGASFPDFELFVVDVATHELTRLTANDQDDQNPAWTPDGKSLIFMSSRDGDEDIWKMPIDAPDQAVDLVDDADAPSSDTMPNCFWGMPAQ